MAVKKSELYSSIWKSCDELRGGMDASQYKDYVLALLFVKYVSDKYSGQRFAPINVPSGGSFADMQAVKGKTDIGEQLNVVIATLAEANRLIGVINIANFNDQDKLGKGEEMQDRLTNLISIFEKPELDFSRNRAEGDDLLGDAYEYLMRNFATQSGKSKGQFYTPSEVSRVMAKIIGLNNVRSPRETIYDPTCGSGSLLLKSADEVPEDVGGITIYGQEKDNSTRALAQMNMILHNNASASIQQGNTLSNPLFLNNNNLQTFDFAVANPPFSDKAWSNGINPSKDIFNRFVDGIPPAKNGDYAFLQHLIRSLKSRGKGAIILPHGVLFRGNVEAEIRRSILQRGYIKGIIGLPANLFYGTGIPACIIVIDKENASARRGIFMIDASKGFMKDGNKNRLRHQDIHKMVDVFNNQIEVPRYSRMVTFDEIESNEFNLNIPRYIDTTEPEDIQDIEAHLLGGIPNRDLEALERYWKVLPTVAEAVFKPNERDGYSDLRLSPANIKSTIFEHPEFIAYSEQVNEVFGAWKSHNLPQLRGINIGDSPKTLIEQISEDLLLRFADNPLIDKYDIYQHMMTYWTEVMQDDVYVLVADGWMGGNKIPEIIEAFDHMHRQEAELNQLIQQMTDLDDEHGDKDGLLYYGKSKGKYTKKRISNRIKNVKGDPNHATEIEMLIHFFDLMKAEDRIHDIIAKIWARLYTLVDETLIPHELIIKRYFAEQQNTIHAMELELENTAQMIQELIDEHGGEGGLLDNVMSDTGNISKASVNARLKSIEGDPDEVDEYNLLLKFQGLQDTESDLKAAIKDADSELYLAVIAQYLALSEDDIKVLVIEDKWLTRIEADLHSELDRVSQTLTGRIKQLADRYANTLPELEARAEAHRQNVQAHLKKMGYTWNT